MKASYSPGTSQTSPSTWLENFFARQKLLELEPSQLTSLRSLALKRLARSTEDWVSPWGKTYRYIEGIVAYGQYVFGYSPAEHHAEMLEAQMVAVMERRNTMVLEPRGGAKTTWGDTIFLCWILAEYPDLRIGLISNTAKQSNDFSRAIRWTYESNPRHHEIYGNCVSPSKWTDVEWLHKDSKWHGSKDVSVYSAGAGGAIISKRFDLLLMDDILDEDNVTTPEAREKLETWFFKTLLPCLVPDGVVIALGTRWHESDLYAKFTSPRDKGGLGWHLVLRKALTYLDDGTPVSYWPEHWPVSALEEKLEELGLALFMCAYQNDIRGLIEGTVFRASDWQYDGFYFDSLPEGRTYTFKMGVDLASSEKQQADYTTRIVTAEDNLGEYWVMSVFRAKISTGHAEFINDGYVAFPKIGLVRCEKQAFQSTLVQEVMQDYPYIPIEGVQQDTDKVTRARAVAAKYEAHRVHHHRSLQGSDFELELTGFPKAAHDDMVDGLGLSMDLGGNVFWFAGLKR